MGLSPSPVAPLPCWTSVGKQLVSLSLCPDMVGPPLFSFPAWPVPPRDLSQPPRSPGLWDDLGCYCKMEIGWAFGTRCFICTRGWGPSVAWWVWPCTIPWVFSELVGDLVQLHEAKALVPRTAVWQRVGAPRSGRCPVVRTLKVKEHQGFACHSDHA